MTENRGVPSSSLGLAIKSGPASAGPEDCMEPAVRPRGGKSTRYDTPTAPGDGAGRDAGTGTHRTTTTLEHLRETPRVLTDAPGERLTHDIADQRPCGVLAQGGTEEPVTFTPTSEYPLSCAGASRRADRDAAGSLAAMCVRIQIVLPQVRTDVHALGPLARHRVASALDGPPTSRVDHAADRDVSVRLDASPVLGRSKPQRASRP